MTHFHSIAIGESFLSIRFFSIQAGSELDVIEALKKQGHACVYKALGQYDVVSFIETKNLDDPKIYSSCDGVHDSRSVVAYQINNGKYKSPENIINWVDGKPLIGFVLLELDKWLYTPESGAKSGMDACVASINAIQKLAEEKEIEVAIYGGLGQSELYAIIRSDNLDDIWRFTSICRCLTFEDINIIKSDTEKSLFTRTRTTPCISYNAIHPLDNGSFEVKDIKGECNAYISVSCPSGFVHYLRAYFPKSDYSIVGVFGNKDAIITTVRPLNTIDLLANILNFRNLWEKERIAPIITVTSIVDPNDYEIPEKSVSTYRTNGNSLSIDIPDTLVINSPRLANRIISFVNRLNSYSINRSYQTVLNQLISYVDYIQKLLNEYQENDEAALFEAIETAEMGLAQRTDSDLDTSHLNSSLPLPFGEGIFSSLVAIECLINYIFVSWCSENQDPDRYVGFPAFSDSFGFQVRWGETIFLPLEAIYDATSATGNWLTLTHEISHAIYLRLGIEREHEEYFKTWQDKNFPTRKIEYSLGFYTPIYDQLNELFAHWYDYYHFYNKDLDQYLKNIWLSWLKLPIVHQHFSEYFFRSFVVFIMNDYLQMISCCFQQGKEDTYNYLSSKWKEHLSIFEELGIIDANTPIEYINYVCSKQHEMCELFIRYAPMLVMFHKNYSNDNFRNKINYDYPKLNEHFDLLKKNQIILGNIENPYILTKKLVIHNQGKTDLRSSVALIMSLKNKIFRDSDQ